TCWSSPVCASGARTGRSRSPTWPRSWSRSRGPVAGHSTMPRRRGYTRARRLRGGSGLRRDDNRHRFAPSSGRGGLATVKPLSVCLCTTFFPPHGNDHDARYVFTLANALAGRGHRVTVVHHPGAARLPGRRLRTAEVPLHPGVEEVPLH